MQEKNGKQDSISLEGIVRKGAGLFSGSITVYDVAGILLLDVSFHRKCNLNLRAGDMVKVTVEKV